MYWTLELASYLDDAPWPATKDELIDYGIRSGAPLEVIENLCKITKRSRRQLGNLFNITFNTFIRRLIELHRLTLLKLLLWTLGD